MTTQAQRPDLDAKVPDGPIQDKWDSHRFAMKLVNPANKRKYEIIVVGTGLAGRGGRRLSASWATTSRSSPTTTRPAGPQHRRPGRDQRRQELPNDGDSIFRLFYDTVKGGDYRSREANVYRLAQVSNEIIDQCTAQGVPFAREYGGLLDNRSFGGAQVSRTFYAAARPASSCCSARTRPWRDRAGSGMVEVHNRAEMLDSSSRGRARRNRRARPASPVRSRPTRPRRRAGHRRLQQRVSSSPRTP